MNLLSYLLRRLIGFVAVMIGVSIITFGLSHLVPADPAIVALGDHATDAQIDAFREKYGLNKPVPEQYWIYVTNLIQGDLGISLRTRRPVAADLHDFFPATFELSLTALVLSILIGVPAGVISSTARNHLPDHVVRVISLIGGSVPIFWLGLILIGFFYGRLGWLPGGARIDKFIPPPPMVTGLFTIDSLLAQDYKAFWSSVHHLLLPGLGRYATNSAINLDFPAVMGVTLLAALVYTVTNLIVDVGYHWLDPRIRHG